MQALVNRIDLRVIGNAFQRDVWHGFVDKAALEPFMRVAQGKVVKAGRHQPLLGQGDGYARGVAGNPATAPFFSDVGCGAAAASGVQDEVAGVGGHEHAAFDYLVSSLNDIHLL